MDFKTFSEAQKQALADLLVAGMYADHHLALAEDARLRRLLDGFGFSSSYERQQFLDAACARAGRMSRSPGEAAAQVRQLAACFTRSSERAEVYEALKSLLTSDQRVTEEENQLLAALRDVFQL